jgi:signal transduction histidine kinase
MTNSPHLDALETAKLAALKELAYGASHEINNPLANIAARAQALLRNEVDPERRRALEAIHQQALRAHEMISDLMLYARPPRLEKQDVSVLQLLEQVQSELTTECRRRGVELHIAADPALPAVFADGNQLAVAVNALCANALEAIGQGGRIELAASLINGGRSLQIAVRDDGPGVPPAIRPHIFEPFYSGREAGRGLGFGLSKCWRIVTEHGGRIAVDARGARGAAFTVEIPLDASPA